PKDGNDDLDAFDPLQPPGEQEVGPPIVDRPALLVEASRLGVKERELDHRAAQAALLVHADGEQTRAEKGVDMSTGAAQQTRMAPELRRTAPDQLAAEAGRLGADLAVEFPQHVHRADQPVLDEGAQLEPASVAEGVRAAEQ